MAAPDKMDKEMKELLDSLPDLPEAERPVLNWRGDRMPTEEDIARIRQETEDIINSLSSPTPEIVAGLRRDCSELIQSVTRREYSTTEPKTT